ncbi:GNAT family N-acetyltransferase [Pseudomonas sp. NPDC007930]|uniref:GNAT family N-acetyltransferase n=1 Tax=Pseudomonas sp. NPDC007930 TaxID=3364417 RepID=UPI0036E87D2F
MDALPTFTTQRLLLTPLQLADAAAIQQLFPHWEVVRYLNHNVPWPYPADGALTFVRDHALPASARGEERHWMIRLRQAPAQCIGSIGLYEHPGNHRGFWLAPAWQGQGYMREACQVINHYWFVTLQRPLMHVPKAEANLASKRVSVREGMRCVRTEPGRFVAGEMLQETWELRREDWLRTQPLDQEPSP